MSDEFSYRGHLCLRRLGCIPVSWKNLGVERIAGSVDRGNPCDDEPAHVLEANHVLRRVAPMGACLVTGWTEAVSAIPCAQRGGRDPEAARHRRNREAGSDSSGLHQHIVSAKAPNRISSMDGG